MMYFSVAIPDELKHTYLITRIVLYSIVTVSIMLFTFQTLFPTLTFSFNFRTPSSSKNNLLDPHTEENVPNMNGKMSTGDTLLSTASLAGQFSRAKVDLVLEKKSAPLGSIEASIKRSYRSFLLPIGTSITTFPLEPLYKVNNDYYALRDNKLALFVSDTAFLSRYRETDALSRDVSFLAQYTPSESFIGYRIGSTVSFADGVFLIVSETEMRPFGSAEIFLALGYRFENVIPANEEEIGIYKRGKIITVGMKHPDGTLFFDQDAKTFYLTEGNFKRPLENDDYLTFLKDKQFPIIASSLESEKEVRCTLEPGLFGQSFSCQTPLHTLQPGFGNDFEIVLTQNDNDIDISTLRISFETEASKQSMLTILSKVKQRMLARFGINQ